MNRSETRLLVENWRKVLNEENSDLLNEGVIKNTLLALAFSVPAFFSGNASAKITTQDILDNPGVQQGYDDKSYSDEQSIEEVKEAINQMSEIIAFAHNKNTEDVEDFLLNKYGDFISKSVNDKVEGFTFTRGTKDFKKSMRGYVNSCIKKINKEASKTSEETRGQKLDPEKQEQVDKLAKLIDQWQKNN